MATNPIKGRNYQHHTGRVYHVLELANMNSDKPGWPKTVVYKDTVTGEVWARPIEDWLKSDYKLLTI